MTGKILICDDEKQLAQVFKAILETEGHQCDLCYDGEDAIYHVFRQEYDLVLLDVQMPGLNGFEVCTAIKKNESYQDIPVLFLTGLRDFESRMEGLKVGANDFISKPVEAPELILRVRNMLKLREYSKFLKQYNITLKQEIEKKAGEILKMNDELILANERIKAAYIDTVYRLSMAAEHKDSDTTEHLLRISSLSSLFTSILGFSEDEVERMYFAAPMHDIGKIGIPSEILLKKAALTEKEFDIMKRHTTMGAQMLHGSDSEILKTAAIIAESHHEKWDGSGYPRGLAGENIPLEGRIVMMVDIYDALRSKRPYKEGMSHQQALTIITQGDNRISTKHFDPMLLELFLEHSDEVESLFEEISNKKIDFKDVFHNKSFLVHK
ncbi:MAG: response regulator [Candidatus Marinimicrobia bacterium]|nr:response regulator [Candidatus Neomarinimicrobiota bacterium]